MSPSIKQVLATIVERLHRQYQPERVILYGSYAYGNPTSDSDIDLFIIKDSTDNRVKRAIAVRRILSDSTRRIPVSPRIYTPFEVKERLAMGDQFVEEILTRGIVLYERS